MRNAIAFYVQCISLSLSLSLLNQSGANRWESREIKFSIFYSPEEVLKSVYPRSKEKQAKEKY